MTFCHGCYMKKMKINVYKNLMFCHFLSIIVFYEGEAYKYQIRFVTSAFQDPPERRKLRLIENNAKCRHLKKFSYKGLQQDSTPHTPSQPHIVCILLGAHEL
jgi:hypothetical protein